MESLLDKKKDGRLYIRINSELKERFTKACQNMSTNPNEVVSKLIYGYVIGKYKA